MTDKPVNQTIIKRYKAQRNRGISGFGFYLPEVNRLTHNTKEGRILSLLRRSEAREILFHHRFPTSTANVRNACHPFSTKEYFESNYIVVHNGVLHNEHELKREHEKLGIKYVSEQENGRFNDSEALAFDLARYFEGQVDTLTARGSIAFIAIKRDLAGKPMGVFFGRNYGNPLKMKKTQFSLTLSSEGEGREVEANTLYYFNYDTEELTTRPLTIPSAYYYQAPRSPWAGAGRSDYSTAPKTVEDQEVGEVIRRGAANGWADDKDISSLEDYWAEKGEIRDAKESILNDTNYEYLSAITIVNGQIRKLQERATKLDALSEMTDEELEANELDITPADVNEYCELSDQIRILELVVKELREDYARKLRTGNSINAVVKETIAENDKEEPAQTSIGFHPKKDQTVAVGGESDNKGSNDTGKPAVVDFGQAVRNKVAERARGYDEGSCPPFSD